MFKKKKNSSELTGKSTLDFKSDKIYIEANPYTYIHTHTHTHIYTYIYIFLSSVILELELCTLLVSSVVLLLRFW